ncbi:MAG TPA: LysM peptidoglycan-binding domain-containing protein [Tichowtungia sp.]|nr:LysM peptidoglycan-binding domain-containing protein [Tichowtungia sp.]
MKTLRNLSIVAVHVVVLAGFSLLQGCATGESPVDWLNWPYNSPANEPMLVPEDDYSDSVVLPPAAPAAEMEPMDSVLFTEPVVTEPVLPEEPSQTYVVQKGDTLSGIASMYGTSWKRLAEFNGLSNPNKLYVNQEILIPGSLSASAPVSRPSSPSAGSSSASGSSIRQGSSYVIQKGDTLSGIAKRAGLSVQEIQAANALDSHVIIAGKSLSIPKKGEVRVPSSSAAAESVPAPQVEEPDPAPAPAPMADIAPLEPAASAPVYEHVLYPGETLDDVARQYGSTKDEIMMLNGISSPDEVKPGTKLLVPIPE